MKAFLKKGNWLGSSPMGYDHYGPWVVNEKFYSRHQRFEINKKGEILREAWEWKATGLFSDSQISEKLEARGLKLSKQAISKIWKTPFYCGTGTNRLIEEPINGKLARPY